MIIYIIIFIFIHEFVYCYLEYLQDIQDDLYFKTIKNLAVIPYASFSKKNN